MPDSTDIYVRNAHTLRALERAGFIKEPPEHCRPKNHQWGARYHYVDIEEGKPRQFWWRGHSYRIQYVSGCFFPFLLRSIARTPRPQ